MIPKETSLSSLSGPVGELLLRWHDLRERGQSPSAEELCAGCPDLVDDVRKRMDALEAMEAALGLGPHTTSDSQAAEADPLRGEERLSELPGYEIFEVINQGGMGIVYKARQVRLNRIVAVKMILGGPDAPPEGLARFRAEAEAAARLQHPNVVQIYEVGEYGGRSYFSMEFVEGGSLDRVLARRVIPARAAAQLLEPLARAVHYAHQHGIIHRDLKPANVLLAISSQPSASGGAEKDMAAGLIADCCLPNAVPKIADFGLAKHLDRPGTNTVAGAIMGTPCYMAPERTEANPAGSIGPAVDVYALGAILYETLTGRPPFRGATTFDTLEQVRHHEPVPPSRLQPGISRDLETICLKCLEKDPRRRYLGADVLAEDLRRFLAGEPILARPSSVWSQGIKWAKRKPALAGLVGVSGVAAASLLGSWIWFTAELRDQVQYARTQERVALNSQQLAERRRGEAERGWQAADEQRTEALHGWQAAREQESQARQERQRAEALLQRCLAAIDEHAQATEISKLEMRQTGEPGSILFGLARFFAQTSAAYRQDQGLPASDRDRLADQYAARAVKLLGSAARAKFFDQPPNFRKLRQDSALDPLRSRRDFQNFLAGVEKKPSQPEGTRRVP